MITTSNFKPPWWLRNPHVQTLWPRLFRKKIPLQTTREKLELPDGDFVYLDFAGATDKPLVLILHGLQGSIHSPYAYGLINTLATNNYHVAFLHFRSCTGELNRLPRLYHSGDTGDIDYVIQTLQQRFPNKPINAVGFSLGGNALLKWLGEQQAVSTLNSAVAVSVPMLLDVCSTRINQGFSKLYQWYLLSSMIETCKKKKQLNYDFSNIDFNAVISSKSFWEFDKELTARLHGFEDAHDYYNKSSSRQFLKNIHTPTLIIQSKDDPFTTDKVIPNEDELSEQVTVEVTNHGGHVGFVDGPWPWRTNYWLEKRILDFLNSKA